MRKFQAFHLAIHALHSAQRASLTALQDAAAKAADILKSSCPPDARTPPARLAAVGTRLDVMLQAIGTVRPALDKFYGLLNDEQKAKITALTAGGAFAPASLDQR